MYTFRNEEKYLACDWKQDPYNELEDFFKLNIDGYYTDFPATVTRFLNMKYENGKTKDDIVCPSGSNNMFNGAVIKNVFTSLEAMLYFTIMLCTVLERLW